MLEGQASRLFVHLKKQARLRLYPCHPVLILLVLFPVTARQHLSKVSSEFLDLVTADH